MKINKLATLLIIVFCCVVPLGSVLAAEAEYQIVPTDHYENGDYTIASFEDMAIFIGKAILGLSGSFALAMFVWGGIQMIIAAGKAEAFRKGKDTVVNALIGLAIIFCSYLIIDFFLDAVGVKGWTRNKINEVMNINSPK